MTSRPIIQSVTLPTRADSLYRMYLNAKTHAAITGGKVTVSARRGSKFSAFGGLLWGRRTLHTVPGRLIVQAWRAANFYRHDVDSTLILRFIPMGAKARIELTHVNVPAQDHRGVSNGWKKYYWRPWGKYLGR